VQKEDMSSVRKVLVSVGYGTPKWDRFVERSPEEVSQAIDYLLENEGFIAGEGKVAPGGESAKKRKAAIEPKATGNEMTDGQGETQEDDPLLEGADETEDEERDEEQEVEGEAGPDEDPEGQEAEVDSLTENQPEVQALVEALGEERWKELLADPEGALATLEKTNRREPSDADEAESGDDEDARALKFLEEKHAAAEEELESLKQRFEEAKKDARDLQGELDDEKRQSKALEDQMRRAEEDKGKSAERKQTGGAAAKAQAPSEMASRLQEYEQTIITNEKILATLREQSENDRQQCEEFKESLQREKIARHQFETELDEERQQLKEQIKRIGEVLAGGEEIPSIEEFEQMEADELLDYIEDVEKEKQRALAGLEAMDVQEETYQKQIKVQQVEMDTIQDDLERFKGSNLATEMEDMTGTVHKQRSQLETLMGFSKNLKAQNEHLKERQDPLRKLVDRQNLQEKALVRYVRMNYDRNFIPHQAYNPDQKG
jgi:hypothetical protein